MAKTVTLRLSDDLYKSFSQAAESDNRSLANWIETAALRKSLEDQFVDVEEMQQIFGDENLLKRLKAGSRDARKKKVKRVA